MNEATARIKINKLLEQACWRFFAEDGKPANILLESGASIRASDLNALGNDFEKTTKGYIDFLLLDDKGRPCIVLTQRPGYASEAGWKITDEQPVFVLSPQFTHPFSELPFFPFLISYRRYHPHGIR